MRSGRDGQPVVHPLALTPGGDNAGFAQVGQMAGNLGLGRADDLREIADADLLPGHQIKKPQAGRVTQGAKEPIERVLGGHAHSLAKYICLDECVGRWYG